METFSAKRIQFRNGERHSVLCRRNGLPVHEVTLYLAGFRTRGRAANTIHSICTSLVLLYGVLDDLGVDLISIFSRGEFLSIPDLFRLAAAAQYRLSNICSGRQVNFAFRGVIDLEKIRLRRTSSGHEIEGIGVATQALRIRCIADYLDYLSGYFAANFSDVDRRAILDERAIALQAFRRHIPKVSGRARLGARIGLSVQEQRSLLDVVDVGSTRNPWSRDFVKYRNWLIVILLLATGMRRGELLGMQIRDLDLNSPKLRILRRADAPEDSRRVQPNTKTNDREVEVRFGIMRAIWNYVHHYRHRIDGARRHPHLFVSETGQPLSLKSIDKLFDQLSRACPELPFRLTSHVMRHTWNLRFSEQAELLGIDPTVEERARNEQQGWVDNSRSAATYTRRYVTQKGREVALKLQEQLDEPCSQESPPITFKPSPA